MCSSTVSVLVFDCEKWRHVKMQFMLWSCLTNRIYIRKMVYLYTYDIFTYMHSYISVEDDKNSEIINFDLDVVSTSDSVYFNWKLVCVPCVWEDCCAIYYQRNNMETKWYHFHIPANFDFYNIKNNACCWKWSEAVYQDYRRKLHLLFQIIIICAPFHSSTVWRNVFWINRTS